MAEPVTYDPDKIYDVRVAFPAYVGGWKYLPRDAIEADGDLVNKLIEENGRDVIRSAEPR